MATCFVKLMTAALDAQYPATHCFGSVNSKLLAFISASINFYVEKMRSLTGTITETDHS